MWWPILLGAGFGLTALLFFWLGRKTGVAIGYDRGVNEINALICGEVRDVEAR